MANASRLVAQGSWLMAKKNVARGPEDWTTPFLLASQSGDANTLMFFATDFEADLSAMDEDGTSPLVAHQGNLVVAKALVLVSKVEFGAWTSQEKGIFTWPMQCRGFNAVMFLLGACANACT